MQLLIQNRYLNEGNETVKILLQFFKGTSILTKIAPKSKILRIWHVCIRNFTKWYAVYDISKYPIIPISSIWAQMVEWHICN